MNPEENQFEETIRFYNGKEFELEQFLVGVVHFFEKNPRLNKKPFPIIHSIKSRFKDPEHLKDKLERKLAKGTTVTADNLFEEINDLIGVRILHLYQDQFPFIHNEILDKINSGDWKFVEPPKAYSWDPETKTLYDGLEIETEIRDTYYTSVHYVIKPNNENRVCCELQVRTLFEEIWGEIDHSINYPHATENLACKEQLRVLSKLVSTGTRLADSIFRTFNDGKGS